jgi:hypothetical protein
LKSPSWPPFAASCFESTRAHSSINSSRPCPLVQLPPRPRLKLQRCSSR